MNTSESTEVTSRDLVSNFELFKSAINRITDEEQKNQIFKMLSSVEDRLITCPASARTEHHNCFPGGLVEHSLRVMKNSIKIAKALDVKVSADQLIVASLFHDIGKLGDEQDDYYVEQQSQWHRDKGMLYDYNPNIVYMTVPQRSVWLMSHFGIKLSKNEYLAILLNDGQYTQENKSYAMREPQLATVIHTADLFATKEEKINPKRFVG
jgi:putative nucleotidyltransferase with HDIG domain